MRLITWNIQWGRGMDGRVDLERIVAQACRMADFDVLCLQEIADNFPDLPGNGPENQFAALAHLLPGYTAIEGVALDIPDGSGGRKRFGNMLLSRYPVQQVLRHTLPWEADETRNMPRMLIDATVMAPFGPVRVMTTHLEYSSSLIRRAQVEGIRDAHRAASARLDRPRKPGPGTYVLLPTSRSAILAGDFNMKPDDPIVQRISEPFTGATPAFLDAWTTLHSAIAHPPSFCIYDQTYGEPHCCDFIFLTEDLTDRLTGIHYDTVTRSSDHQPILLEIEE